MHVPAPPGGWRGAADGGPRLTLEVDGSMLLERPDGGRYRLERGTGSWTAE